MSGLKYKLEAKDMDIKELKKLVKMKQEELSEMQVSHGHALILGKNVFETMKKNIYINTPQ